MNVFAENYAVLDKKSPVQRRLLKRKKYTPVKFFFRPVETSGTEVMGRPVYVRKFYKLRPQKQNFRRPAFPTSAPMYKDTLDAPVSIL